MCEWAFLPVKHFVPAQQTSSPFLSEACCVIVGVQGTRVGEVAGGGGVHVGSLLCCLFLRATRQGGVRGEQRMHAFYRRAGYFLIQVRGL